MKRLILAVAICSVACVADAQSMVKKGSTNQTRYVMLVDAADGTPETAVTITGIDLQYTRNQTAPAAKVDATALAATDTAHTDNFAIAVDATSSPGLYRIDWPDAAFATGADKVVLTVTAPGVHPAIEEVQLVDFDPQDTVRLGITALPNAAADAAGGLPISDAGGLDIDNRTPAATAVTNLNTVFNTDFASNYDATNDRWNIDGEVTAALNTYDPPTRAEATSDKNEILATTKKYNNYLHVGSGQTYATLDAAETAFTAGDLIVVHAGTYAEELLDVNNTVWYLLPGATIGNSATGPIWDYNSITKLRVFGEGTIVQAEDEEIVFATQANTDIYIECDTIDRENSGGSAFSTTQATASITVCCRRIISSVADAERLVNCQAGRVSVTADYIEIDDALVELGGSSSVVEINVNHATIGTDELVDALSDDGVLLLNGNFRLTNASSTGINAPSGTTIICESGSVQVPSGRPSLSGSGTIYVTEEFAYNTASATASAVVATTAEKIRTDAAAILVDTGTSGVQLPAGEVDATSAPLLLSAKDNSDTLIGRLTSARALYLDKLNITGNVAGANPLATLQADATLIKTQTDKLSTSLIADGSGGYQYSANALELGPAGDNPAVLAAIDLALKKTEFDTVLDGAPTAQDAVQDAMDAQGYTAARAPALDNASAQVRSSGTITVTDTTHYVLSAGPNVTGSFVGYTLVIDDVSNPGMSDSVTITAYDGPSATATVDEAPIFTAITTDTYRVMLPTGGEVDLDPVLTAIDAVPTAVENRQEMDSNSVDLNSAVTQSTTAATQATTAATQSTNAASTASTINTKLGTPAGASVSADIAGIEVTPTVEVEVVGGGPFEHEIPGEAFIAKLSNRVDGTSAISKPNKCRVKATGEAQVFAVDCTALLRRGTFLASMAEPAIAGDADLTVSTVSYGVNREYAIIRVTAAGTATVGDTATVTYTVTPQVGSSIQVTVPVEVIE